MGTIAVVLDTNVLNSALGFGGTPLDALLRTFDDDVRLLATDVTLHELGRVMGYDRLPFTEADREQYLRILAREVELVSPETDVDVIDRDPDDDVFLECAIDGDARYVVSGDEHLLELGSFRGIEIVTPAEFLRLVR